jgi:glycerophosphoryl diester phosphodiesterase
VHPYFAQPRPHLFAHRGASAEAPENTLPAFARAVELGIPYLELDAHGTRDGEIVICHDEALERTTDGTGPIRERRFAEIERLDAGYRFTRDGQGFPYRGCGVRMPRLAALIDAFPRARFNLELKQRDPPIVDEVVALLRRARATDRFLLAAEDDALLQRVRKADPGTAIGSSFGDVLAFFQALLEGRIEAFRPAGQALQIPTSFAGQPLVTEESLAAARRLGLFVHVWTVNEPDEMRRLLALGVDGLMSDDPARLLEVARAMGPARSSGR